MNVNPLGAGQRKMENRADGALARTEQVGSYTAPFNLADRLHPPETRLNPVPILDLAVIALLVSLLFTRFVSMPGVRVDLPDTSLRMQHDVGAVAVLTLGNEGMILFDGSVHDLRSIDRAFGSFVERFPDREAVLLIKAEANLDLQRFLELCEAAKEAGFDQVQLAGAKSEAVEEIDAPSPISTGPPAGAPLF